MADAKGFIVNPNDHTQKVLLGSSADICFMKDGTPLENIYGKDETNQYTRINSTNHIQLMNDVDVYAPDGASWRNVMANDFKLTDGTKLSGKVNAIGCASNSQSITNRTSEQIISMDFRDAGGTGIAIDFNYSAGNITVYRVEGGVTVGYKRVNIV